MKVSNLVCEKCESPLIEADNGEGFVCPNCARQDVAEEEEHYSCPADGSPMGKEVHGDLILDHCPNCKSYFMSAEELDELIKAWYNEGYNDARWMHAKRY